MSNKKALVGKAIAASLLVILILGGCRSGGTRTATGFNENYRTGTDGVKIEFRKAPTKFYAQDNNALQDELRFDIEVFNEGAFPEPDTEENIRGYVYLSGFDPSIIDFQDTYYDINRDINLLEGRSIHNPNGGYNVLTFKGDVKMDQNRIDKYDATLLATACYEYETHASIPVCIDPDPYATTEKDKVCTVQGSYGGGSGQGGPIVVSRIEEEVMSSKIQFRIYIENRGSGYPLPYDNLDQCNPYESSYTESTYNNRVTFDSVSVSGLNLGSGECKPLEQGRNIRLVNGQGFLYCDMDISSMKNRPAYKTPVLVKLKYVYSDTISHPISFIRVP